MKVVFGIWGVGTVVDASISTWVAMLDAGADTGVDESSTDFGVDEPVLSKSEPPVTAVLDGTSVDKGDDDGDDDDDDEDEDEDEDNDSDSDFNSDSDDGDEDANVDDGNNGDSIDCEEWLHGIAVHTGTLL